uniref:B3 domain-containing protein n=1 Tax=Fagus sylvatica TaxID=28930 RepID=A0A2N9GNZ3_FAGSY
MEDFGSFSFRKLKEEIIGDGNKTRQQVEELLAVRITIDFLCLCLLPLPLPEKKPIILKINKNKQNQRCLIIQTPQSYCNTTGKRKRDAETEDWVPEKPNPPRNRNRNAENEEDWVPEKPNPPKKRPPDPNLKPNAPTLPNPPPDLPLHFKNRINAMNGTQLVLIIQKPLTDTDVNIHNSRLSIPLSQIKPQDFLTEDEIKDFDKHNKVMEEVPFIDPSGEVNTMTLTQWDMRKPSGTKSSSYILRTNWNKVLKANLKTTSELKAKKGDPNLVFPTPSW